MRVAERLTGNTLNHQTYDQTVKYIVGRYEAEIFTIPRIFKNIEVTQSNMFNVEIEAPGQLEYSFNKAQVAQLFQLNKQGFWVGVYTFSDILTKDKLLIQPGNYKLVYRPKDMKSSGYTGEKMITISSNKTTSINIK